MADTTMTTITPAAVRLFARAIEIENEVKDEIADGVGMTDEELIAQSERVLRRSAKILEDVRAGRELEDGDDEDDEDDRKVKAALAKHSEYLYVKAELGKQLNLGPHDINPLDLEFGQQWDGPDDPRMKAWLQAAELNRRLHDAHLEWILGRRPPMEALK
jgi:MoxR-like ATPase